MDLLQPIGSRHRTSDRDHGITFRVRSRQAGDQVRATRPGGDQGHARSACHAADTRGDECRVLFVPADYRLDFGIQQRIEHLIDLGSGDAEDVFDTLCLPPRAQSSTAAS
jgi:hypothetical protein